MEMEKVTQSGYKIVGLNIAGFDRGNLLKNLNLPFKIVSSLLKAKKVIKEFNPDLAVGTGGFASGPALFLSLIHICFDLFNNYEDRGNQFKKEVLK